VIAAGRRDHAGLRHLAQQQIGEGAARLERAGMLQLFQLQGDRAPSETEIAAGDLDYRRAPDIGPDQPLGSFDVLATDRVQGSVSLR